MTLQPAQIRRLMGKLCVRDLNTESGAIPPDRGNHAIKVTEAGRTHPTIPQSVRCLLCHLACAPLGRQVRGICSRAADYRYATAAASVRSALRGAQSLACAGYPP